MSKFNVVGYTCVENLITGIVLEPNSDSSVQAKMKVSVADAIMLNSQGLLNMENLETANTR